MKTKEVKYNNLIYLDEYKRKRKNKLTLEAINRINDPEH